jgi:hypothetical protein
MHGLTSQHMSRASCIALCTRTQSARWFLYLALLLRRCWAKGPPARSTRAPQTAPLSTRARRHCHCSCLCCPTSQAPARHSATPGWPTSAAVCCWVPRTIACGRCLGRSWRSAASAEELGAEQHGAAELLQSPQHGPALWRPAAASLSCKGSVLWSAGLFKRARSPDGLSKPVLELFSRSWLLPGKSAENEATGEKLATGLTVGLLQSAPVRGRVMSAGASALGGPSRPPARAPTAARGRLLAPGSPTLCLGCGLPL